MNLKQFIKERMRKTALMVEITTKKIIRKEFKKLSRDVIKGMLKKNGRTNRTGN